MRSMLRKCSEVLKKLNNLIGGRSRTRGESTISSYGHMLSIQIDKVDESDLT